MGLRVSRSAERANSGRGGRVSISGGDTAASAAVDAGQRARMAVPALCGTPPPMVPILAVKPCVHLADAVPMARVQGLHRWRRASERDPLWMMGARGLESMGLRR